MTRRVWISIALVLGIVAVGALGYAGYRAWDRIQQLEDELAFQEQRALNLAREDVQFYNTLRAVWAQDDMRTAAAEPDWIKRGEALTDLANAIQGSQAKYPDGYEVRVTLERLIDTADEGARQALIDDLNVKLFGIADPREEFIEEPVIVEELPSLSDLAGAITAIGGVGSGLVSLLMFLTGGGRRGIEEEMMALDLEIKRVELAQARYDARDALGFSPGAGGLTEGTKDSG